MPRTGRDRPRRKRGPRAATGRRRRRDASAPLGHPFSRWRLVPGRTADAATLAPGGRVSAFPGDCFRCQSRCLWVVPATVPFVSPPTSRCSRRRKSTALRVPRKRLGTSWDHSSWATTARTRRTSATGHVLHRGRVHYLVGCRFDVNRSLDNSSPKFQRTSPWYCTKASMEQRFDEAIPLGCNAYSVTRSLRTPAVADGLGCCKRMELIGDIEGKASPKTSLLVGTQPAPSRAEASRSSRRQEADFRHGIAARSLDRAKYAATPRWTRLYGYSRQPSACLPHEAGIH